MDIGDTEPGQLQSAPGSTAPSATTGVNATDAQDHDARAYADEYPAYLRRLVQVPPSLLSDRKSLIDLPEYSCGHPSDAARTPETAAMRDGGRRLVVVPDDMSTRDATDRVVHDMQGEHTLSEYEDEYPVYLSVLKDLPPAPSYDLPEDELRHMPPGNKDSGWQNCLNSVEKYDRELCQTYREQIDTLLVFAGLFSAVVTAFAIESYQWLQDDPLDASVELLRDMVALLSQNSNLTAPPTPVATSQIPGSAVARINTFWFLSLSLSLSAALVGILCKQWLREFERSVGKSPERTLAVRDIRFQGFRYWKVGSIVMFVPIIMQLALAFFIIGIIDLLWRLHVVVACCVTVVAGATLLFFLATTFLPVIQYAYICIRCCIEPLKPWNYSTTYAFTESQCAYKSAQSWLVFRVFQPLIERLLRTYGHQFSTRNPRHRLALQLHPANSWITFDLNWVHRREHVHHGPRCAFRSLSWIAMNLGDLQLSSWVWHCVWGRWLRNRNSHDSITMASSDIGAVAHSYPGLDPPSLDFPPHVRAQALVFQCSLRADIPVDTVIELFLRVAPMVGLNSQWTRLAVQAVLAIYPDLSIQISDDLAVGLFRLAEMQTRELLVQPDGPDPETQLNGALAFRGILLLINRGSRLRTTLMVAMSGLVLQWLRADPPTQIALVARSIFADMINYLGSRAYCGEDWHHYPGIILVAKLAETVSQIWPDVLRQRYVVDLPSEPPVLQELLAMASDESALGLARIGSDGVTPPQSEGVNGQRSSPPAPGCHDDHSTSGDVQPEPPGPLAPPAEACRPSSRTHLSIDMQGDTEMHATTEIDVNRPVSPSSGLPSPERRGQLSSSLRISVGDFASP